MSLWAALVRLLHPSEVPRDQVFSMGDRRASSSAGEHEEALLARAQIRTTGVLTHIEHLLEADPSNAHEAERAGDLSDSLDENVERLKQIFCMPANKDLILREIQIAVHPPVRATVSFMEGLSDRMVINAHILKPLMLTSHLDHHLSQVEGEQQERFSLDKLLKRLLPGHQVSERYQMTDVVESLLAGDTVLLFERSRVAIAVETKSPPSRSISEPKNEQVIWGPRDSFHESWRINVALVRRRIKDPRVVTEILTVGEISKTYVGLLYINGLTSPKLVAEVRRRVEAIRVDAVSAAGMLEQYIEDAPSAIFPGMLLTERPDRAAAYLSEGHVLLLVDNAPRAIICPITFWALLQTSEDYYLRSPFITFLRILRMAAFFIAMVVPALYIAILNYHQEMFPTELMMFIASTREGLPLPSVVELLMLDLLFELIREAGVRIPSIIGPTVGLVASLVLGQAAVQARIISPVMVIIVAATGLAFFAVPSYITGFGIRLLRFVLLAAAAVLGVYGIAIVLFMVLIHLAGMRSFGVPYLSPVAPAQGRVNDVFARAHLFDMEMRPNYIHPVQQRRQQETVRTWDPFSAKEGTGTQKDEGGDDS